MFSEMDIIDYLAVRKSDDVLVDVWDKTTFAFGTVEGAINIPIESIKELYRLPKDKDIYLFCQAGDVSGELAELLSDAGYSACNLTGGYRKYLVARAKKD